MNRARYGEIEVEVEYSKSVKDADWSGSVPLDLDDVGPTCYWLGDRKYVRVDIYTNPSS